MDTPIIHEVPGSDPDLAAALAAAGLPTDDLTAPGRHFFRFAVEGEPIGYIGWEEIDQAAALLRSLLVLPDRRGQGWGAGMTDWALLRLAELGFTDAWVLTTSAEGLALRHGFARVERVAVPEAVRRTQQFAGLCPASTIVLHRRLP